MIFFCSICRTVSSNTSWIYRLHQWEIKINNFRRLYCRRQLRKSWCSIIHNSRQQKTTLSSFASLPCNFSGWWLILNNSVSFVRYRLAGLWYAIFFYFKFAPLLKKKNTLWSIILFQVLSKRMKNIFVFKKRYEIKIKNRCLWQPWIGELPLNVI